MTSKCKICRYACKSEQIYKCKFYPQEKNLGWDIHFKDPMEKRHHSDSRICVVCKDYFSPEKIHWKKEKDGYYSFCAECFKRATFIDEMLVCA